MNAIIASYTDIVITSINSLMLYMYLFDKCCYVCFVRYLRR